MQKIQEVPPQVGPHYDTITDFHQPVPADRYEQELREGYARRTPLILKKAPYWGGVGVNFMLFNYGHNAEAAYFTICSEGITLYPYYPFQHLFITLACPWRKLAVLVEEEETPWTEQQIQDENELLTLSGWRVFRIPTKVAKSFKSDFIPGDLLEAEENGFEDEDQKQAYLEYSVYLPTHTIDGFFHWLKQEHFSKSARVGYRMAARNRLSEELRNIPAPEPEEEADALMYQPTRQNPPLVPSIMETSFKIWAQYKSYNLDQDEQGNYLTARTQGAWEGWQAAHEPDVNIAFRANDLK